MCSLIICRARRCTLSSWASEVVDEPIKTRGAYSRSGRTNPLYIVSRCLGLSIGAARRRRCRRLLARRATDRMWLLNIRWVSKVTPRQTENFLSYLPAQSTGDRLWRRSVRRSELLRYSETTCTCRFLHSKNRIRKYGQYLSHTQLKPFYRSFFPKSFFY